MVTTLAEDLLLVTLDSSKGKLSRSAAAALPFGLAGALLTELMLQDRIQTDEENNLVVKDASPRGQDILDEALAQLHQSQNNISLNHWIWAFSHNMSHLEDRLLGRLVAKGIVRRKESCFWGRVPLTTYPLENPRIKEELRWRLRSAALGGDVPDGRSLVLLGLADACNLTGEIFSAEERQQAHKRLKETTGGTALGKIAFEVMYAVTASAAVAVIAASHRSPHQSKINGALPVNERPLGKILQEG